jgi:RNA-directed DNA polymerase
VSDPRHYSVGPRWEPIEGTPTMNGHGKSDRVVVPQKSPNKAGHNAAEAMEGSTRAKENLLEQNAHRTQGRDGAPSALERIRQAARRDKEEKFTSLMHHVSDPERLQRCYRAIERNAAAGVDGETWRHYGEQLEENIQDLCGRLKRGAYRAKPVRRAYIEKSDGRLRPLGVPTLEDKIVQRSCVEVLGTVYEQDFLGLSYGFRPGRNQHQALDALSVAITTKKVNWVLDADLRDFFGTLQHEWVVKFVEHRVADERVIRLIQKWLSAGVLEDGKRTHSETGTVQGGSISPLLANIYLHYVLDLWVEQWRKRNASGDVIMVRYADDFVMGFEHRHEAERFLAELRERLAQFGLQLHPDKTRLIEFGRQATENRRARGEGSPETFGFLGFTHSCGKTRRGKFKVLRQTMRKRLQAKLKAVKVELRKRMHDGIKAMGTYLRSVLTGHARYYGVPDNSPALMSFRFALVGLWIRTLRRRSQKHRLPWKRMTDIARQWLPYPRICHPWPSERFYGVTI